MYRFAAALAVVLATTAVLASTATADPPTRFPIDNGSQFTFSGLCAFDVQFTVLANNEYGITFSNGTTIITGRLVFQLTNLSNDKSIVVNASGPGFFTPTSTVITGTSLLLRFSTGGLFLTRGPLTFDQNGNPVITSAATVDLCAALT
jgi:hypothetical protein